jgi:fibronectin-binding autotransporter adhesin
VVGGRFRLRPSTVWRAVPVFLTLLVGVAGLSCVGDSTGPHGYISGRLALVPSFQSAAAGIVDFDRIRITLVRLDETVPVLDTIIQIPPTADSIDLSLSVPLSSASEDLLFYLRLIDAAGDTVFRNEPYPQQITVTSGTRPAAVPTPLEYIGVGADAAAVIIGTPDTLVPFGQALQLNATALDSSQQAIPGTPIEWLSLDPLRVRVPDRRVGQVVGGTQRGAARIVARLLTGPADTVIVVAQPVPSGISVVSGGGQSAPAGSVLPQPLRVRVIAQDGLGVSVPVSFRALSTGASVSDTSVTSDSLGYAEVTGTLGPLAGAQSFQASVTGLFPVTFNVTSVFTGPFRVAFVVGPTGADAGVPVTPAIEVAVQDGGGGTVSGATNTVTLSFGPGAGSAELLGTLTVDAVDGVATFSDIAIDRAATGYTLVATATGLVSDTSAAFAISPAPAAQLIVASQPTQVFAGTAFPGAVTVEAQDAFGNTATDFAGLVALAIGTNPGAGTLSGAAPATAASGVATFLGLSIDNPGTGYTLVASADGLTDGTSGPIDVVPPPGTIVWSNTAGGNWSNPANWSGGVVPGSTEIASITLPGTYTVILDQSDTVAGLQLGASSGTQTLSGASRTLHASIATQISANGVLELQASTLAGGPLTTAGSVQVTGSSIISQAIATTATSLIRVQGNNVYGHSTLTVANGFVNNGAIVLTDTISTYGATVTLPAGQTLTQGSSGTLVAAVGSGGSRTLTAALDNQGTVTLNRPLTINRVSAVHTNSGTIDILAGDLTLSQSGGGASFTTNGTISIGAGQTLAVSGGAFDYTAGSITGAGTLSLTSASVTLMPTLSTGSVGISLTSTTVGGAGTLDVADATSIVIRASTINAPFANHGLATFNGSTTLNGGVVNDGTATLRVQGNNVYGHATVTAANSFTNDGAIVLTDTVSTYGATLTLNAGATLTNAGTIDAAVGSGGARNLTAALDNQGTVTLNRPLLINRVGAVHTNSGTFDVTGGDLTLSQSGASASFTMVGSGAVNVAPGRTFAISGGALNYDAGSISGGGTLVITNTAVTSTQGFNTATAALSLISSTWGGAGALTVSPSTVLDVRASTISAPLANQAAIHVTGSSAFTGGFTNPSAATLTIQGNNVYGHSTLTVGTSFTNGGTIVLTDTISTYGATLTMPVGTTLTNAAGGTIDAAAGSAGVRTLTVELDNQGTVTLNRPLTLNRASAAHLNSGTINVSAGDFTLSQSGTSPPPSFTTSGSILIGSGRTFAMSGGAFNYNAGAITGGTLSVTSTNVTATQNFNTATSSLSIASSTWGGTGTLTLSASTEVRLRASTINAPLVNEGLLIASGSSAINGTLSNDSAATLRVQGDNTYGAGNLTIANSFANDGAIELTDTVSTYGATLTMPAGQTLTNAAGGTISALPGTNGSRALTAQLDNYGVITVATAATQGLTINRSGAQHQNRGTIAISGGDLTVSQSGASPSFRTTGAITVAAGDTLHITGGSFVYDSGSISGSGALTLASLTGSAAFNIAHSIASLSVTSSTASFATAQSTGSTGFFFSSAVINGPGLLTNAAGQFLNVRASTINADLINQGTLLVNGNSSFTGALTTDTSSRIRVQGNGIYGHSTMTVSNAFTNNGMIELTDTTSTYGSTLTLLPAGGTLTNSPTGTIAAVLGTLGTRTLSAQLDNQGVVSVTLASNGLLTLGRSGAVHQNSGVIDVSGGDVTITQSAGGSFTNSGTITIGGGDTLTVNNGSLTHNTGTFGGAGTLALSGLTAAFNAPHTFAAMTVTSSTVAFATPQSTAATDFAFLGSFIDGPAPFTNDAGRLLPLRSTVVRTALHNAGTILSTGATSFTTDTLTTSAGSLIRIQGNGTFGSSNLTVARGFENAGTIVLTDTVSTYGATLTVPNGKLVNLVGAFIVAAEGGNGTRTLTAELDNQGMLVVDLQPGRDLLVNRAGSVHTNVGTIDIIGGDLVVTSGAIFQSSGAINLGATDTLSITSGMFSYDAGTLGFGTLVLNSVNPANFNASHSLGSIVLNNTAATFNTVQSTANTDFTLTNSTFNGLGSLTNEVGKTMAIRTSAISGPFTNNGTLIARGASTLDAPTTGTGSTLRVEGDGTSGTGTLTVNGGIVNNGAIELTDVGAAYGASLIVKTLPLVNAGTIDIQPGANGTRTIDAVIDNQGTFTGNHSVTISHADAVHTNRGTMRVAGGNLTVIQSGGNPSFSNGAGGVIDIDAGRTFRITAGNVTNAPGAKIMGSGTFDVSAPATFSNAGDILPGKSPGILTLVGNYSSSTGEALHIELGGPAVGTEYDRFVVTGNASISGALNVTTINGFNPPVGTFILMTFADGGGTRFGGTVTVPPNCSQPQYSPTQVQITCS